MSDILRVHEWSYISLLQKASASCTDTHFAALDSDTIISKGSFCAALAAAGAVISAVDNVMEEQACPSLCCRVAMLHSLHSRHKITIEAVQNGSQNVEDEVEARRHFSGWICKESMFASTSGRKNIRIYDQIKGHELKKIKHKALLAVSLEFFHTVCRLAMLSVR